MVAPSSLPPSLLTGVTALVGSRLGLHFPEHRGHDLERGLAAAAHDLGVRDAEACAHVLLSESLTRRHLEILASHLTVGETYFFREPAGLEAFEQHILPDLVASRSGSERRLRIWSAGCCTGEEPYSIAMILDRAIPNRESWDIAILATDINPRFLRRAAEGIYGEWSLRATSEALRRRYFTRRGKRFELSEQIRSAVTFSYLNLAEDIYPSLLNNTNAMDVIFCRNVLMYFDVERRRRVVHNLHRSLSEEGWLIVSPVETSTELYSGFAPVQVSGAVLYRKQSRPPADRPIELPGEPAIPLPPAAVSDAGPRPVAIESSSLAFEIPADPAPDRAEVTALVARARQYANEGRLSEAAAAYEVAVSRDKTNPAHHYLLATVHEEMGDLASASQGFRRSLFLESRFVLARLGLASVEMRRGRVMAAERHLRNARDDLRAHEAGEVLIDTEGLTAERLTEIVESLIESLPRHRSAERGSGG